MLINAQKEYKAMIEPLPHNVTISNQLEGQTDLIWSFATSPLQVLETLKLAKKHLKPAAALWISWPKKSAKVLTNLDENIIREIGLKAGLVDIKVIAVDAVWSGLKFVHRLKDR